MSAPASTARRTASACPPHPRQNAPVRGSPPARPSCRSRQSARQARPDRRNSPHRGPDRCPQSSDSRACPPPTPENPPNEIGGATCRERVCQYVKITVGAVSLKKKNKQTKPPQNETRQICKKR